MSLTPRAEVVRTSAGLDRLAAAWTDLVDEVPDAALSQTFAYARAAWSGIAEPAGRRLAVVTVRVGTELHLVWPLQVEHRRLFTVVSHLGNGSGQEYATPAVRPGPHAERVLAAATTAAQRLGDVLAIYHVPGAPLPLTGTRLPEALTFHATTTSHVARHPANGGYDAWLGQRPAKLRWEIRRNRRRLSEAGALSSFSSDDDPSAGHEALGWIFEHKRRWLVKRGLRRDWIVDGSAERFFHELLDGADGALPRLVVIGLRLDGAIASASICYRSRGVLEGFVIAFDESLARLGPGNVLMEECVRRAFDDGEDFDFRIDPFAYKLRWTDVEVAHHTQLVPCTVRGIPFVASNHLRRAGEAARRTATPWLERGRPSLAVARALVDKVLTAGGRRAKRESA